MIMRKVTAYSVFSGLGVRKFFNWMPDATYLKIQYRLKMGKKLNLKAPELMSEKLQWLKIHDRKPEYTMLADKYLVREHIAEVIGEDHLIPLLGVWEDPDSIDFDKLPDQFVLKCNHDSGGVVICREKSKLDQEAARKKLKERLGRVYCWGNREWPYQNIPRKVICEKYMTDSEGKSDLTDYKFYCCNGVADCVVACVERASGDPKFYFFDQDWKLLRYNEHSKAAPEGCTVPRPDNLEEMFEAANKLASSVDCPFLRVDLYSIEGKMYFGELTFFPHSGMDTELLPEIDRYFGDKIRLPIELQ